MLAESSLIGAMQLAGLLIGLCASIWITRAILSWWEG
jgi:hypothetical protein